VIGLGVTKLLEKNFGKPRFPYLRLDNTIDTSARPIAFKR
jgi:hypothetical protein